jgi:polyisoprenoid-binding protein YceI
VTGEFTLRGVSQPLTLRALQFHCRTDATPPREVCGGDFEAELRRSDFGITHSLPFVADRVRLVIQVEAFR